MDNVKVARYPLTALLLVVFALASPSSARAQLQGERLMPPIWNGQPGSAPLDFNFARTGQGDPARWVIVEDATAQNSRAVEQTSKDTTDYRFPLAIYSAWKARDVEVTVRFKTVAGKVDQAGGIAIRLNDPDNYYVVRANALEDNVRLYRMMKGKRELIAGVETKVSTNAWHSLGILAEGNRFTVMFDGRSVFTATDDALSDAGNVAIWTKADSVTRFDQLTMKSLDEGEGRSPE